MTEPPLSRLAVGMRHATESGTAVKAPRLLLRHWTERRRVVLAAAAIALVGIAAAINLTGHADLAVLAVVPVMLVALELGIRGGVAAAAFGCALIALAPVDAGAGTDIPGTLARAFALVSVAVIAGRFSDRMREVQRRAAQTLQSGLRLSALGDKDALPVVVAQSAMRVVDADGASVDLEGFGSATLGHSDPRAAITPVQVRGRGLGEIEVSKSAGLRSEDRATLRLLALQAGLAVENLLLLERERERVAVEGELRAARSRLDEQQSALGHLVKDQEAERMRVAAKLHDDLGQILAAVLWGLQLLPVETENPTLPELRGQVVSVLDDLREIAGSLRPPTLDQLGLVSALGTLADRARSRDGLDVSINAGPLPAQIPADVQTGIYRIVEDAIAQLGGEATSTMAELSEDRGILQLVMILPLPGERAALLGPIRGRAELLGGTLQVQELGPRLTRLIVDIPLYQETVAKQAA